MKPLDQQICVNCIKKLSCVDKFYLKKFKLLL